MEEIIARKFHTLRLEWNERQRRLWAASEAMCLGHGGVSIVGRATGLSRPTILKGIKELKNSTRPDAIGSDTECHAQSCRRFHNAPDCATCGGFTGSWKRVHSNRLPSPDAAHFSARIERSSSRYFVRQRKKLLHADKNSSNVS